ncbi:hypothetical protein DFH09DRAFT_1072222 [Mycena vulgaris]|nr:hypothetical protein DFH09DRAFT_1072222 [Mycena vulgaris]
MPSCFGWMDEGTTEGISSPAGARCTSALPMWQIQVMQKDPVRLGGGTYLDDGTEFFFGGNSFPFGWMDEGISEGISSPAGNHAEVPRSTRGWDVFSCFSFISRKHIREKRRSRYVEFAVMQKDPVRLGGGTYLDDGTEFFFGGNSFPFGWMDEGISEGISSPAGNHAEVPRSNPGWDLFDMLFFYIAQAHQREEEISLCRICSLKKTTKYSDLGHGNPEKQ